MENIIDFRSDTITLPEKEVLSRTIYANIGDDVYGEDAETNRLQDYVSSLLGKEDSLFVPTGTMANLIALMIYNQDGGEVILDQNSHPVHYESGGMSRVAGLCPRFAKDRQGIINPESIRHNIRPNIYYQPKTVLIWLENTHNRGGGTVYPLSTLEEIYDIALENNLPVHIDGARFLNACVHSEKSPAELAKFCSSISICFSKALRAPLGSMLSGDRDFISRARRVRKMLGGGMRQTGYISFIAGHYLHRFSDMFRIDHGNAERIYDALLSLDLGEAIWGGTNIVLYNFFKLEDKLLFEEYLKHNDIFVSSLSENSVRIVVSNAQGAKDIEKALNIIRSFSI